MQGSPTNSFRFTVAFDPLRDCQVCKAQALAKVMEKVRIPKRTHHPQCIKNTKTKGKGQLSLRAMATLTEEKRLKALYEQPLDDSQKGSGRHTTKEAGNAFFAPRPKPKKNLTTPSMPNPIQRPQERLTAQDLCKAV